MENLLPSQLTAAMQRSCIGEGIFLRHHQVKLANRLSGSYHDHSVPLVMVQ